MNNPRAAKTGQKPILSRRPNNSQLGRIGLHGTAIRPGTVASRITYLQSLARHTISSNAPQSYSTQPSTEYGILKGRVGYGKCIISRFENPEFSNLSDQHQASDVARKHTCISHVSPQSKDTHGHEVSYFHCLPTGVILGSQLSLISPKSAPRVLDSGTPEKSSADAGTLRDVNNTRRSSAMQSPISLEPKERADAAGKSQAVANNDNIRLEHTTLQDASFSTTSSVRRQSVRDLFSLYGIDKPDILVARREPSRDLADLPLVSGEPVSCHVCTLANVESGKICRRCGHRLCKKCIFRPESTLISKGASTFDTPTAPKRHEEVHFRRTENNAFDGATSPAHPYQISVVPSIRPSSARRAYTTSVYQSEEKSQQPPQKTISQELPSRFSRSNPPKLQCLLSGIQAASYIPTPPFSLSGALLDGGGGPRVWGKVRTDHDFVIRHHHHRRHHLAHHRSHYSSDECDESSGCISPHGIDVRASPIDEEFSRRHSSCSRLRSRPQSRYSRSQNHRHSYQSVQPRPPSRHNHSRERHHSRKHSTSSSSSSSSSSSDPSDTFQNDAPQVIECRGYPRTGHARHNSPMNDHGIVGVCQHCLNDCTCEACRNTHHNVRCCVHESHQPFVHHHTIGGRRSTRRGGTDRPDDGFPFPDTSRPEVEIRPHSYQASRSRDSHRSQSGRQLRIDEWNRRPVTPSICVPSRSDYVRPSRRASRRSSACTNSCPEMRDDVEEDGYFRREITDRCPTRTISHCEEEALIDIYAGDQRPRSPNGTLRGIRSDNHCRKSRRRRPVRDVVRFVEQNGRLPRSLSGMSRSRYESRSGEEHTLDNCVLVADDRVKEHQLGDIVCIASVPGQVEDRPFLGSIHSSRIGSHRNSHGGRVSIHNSPRGSIYGSRHGSCRNSNLSSSSSSSSSSRSSSSYRSPLLPTHCGSRHYSPRLRTPGCITPQGYPRRGYLFDDTGHDGKQRYASGCRQSRDYSCGQERSHHISHYSHRKLNGNETPPSKHPRRLNRSRRYSDLRDEIQNHRHSNEEHECVWKRRFMKSKVPIYGSGTEDDLQGITVILRFGNREDVVVNTDLRRGETVDFDV